MMRERAICELLSARLPRGRLNRCFESDAEIIRLGRNRYLFTTDEFSAEDLFREDDAYGLGWNVAAGGVSDILACGGTPLYYAHALTVAPDWSLRYIRRFGDGVRDVLGATGARFIGGDCGQSALWRCTVSVLGTCGGRPVLRRGARPGDVLYVTGRIGAGNLEAALRLDPDRNSRWARSIRTRFPLRVRESVLIRRHASSCIDTSDGLWSSLNALADLNGCGYAVANLPYLVDGLRAARTAGWPLLLLFLGECGEYELLFTVRPDRIARLRAEATRRGCTLHRLGVITREGRTLIDEGRALDLGSVRARARDYETPQRYLEVLRQWLARQPRGTAPPRRLTMGRP